MLPESDLYNRLSAIEQNLGRNNAELARLTESLHNSILHYDKIISDHDEILFGNGTPGLAVRVDRLEGSEERRSKTLGFLGIAVTLPLVDALKRWILGFVVVGVLSVSNGVLSVSNVRADIPPQQFRGFSSYAALNPSFPCDKFLAIESHAELPAMVVLWGTFGDDDSCVQKFMQQFKDKPNLLEIHFSNEVCRRNKKSCGHNELFPQYSIREYNKALQNLGNGKYTEDLYTILNRAIDITQFCSTLGNRNTTCVLSTGLEDNYTQSSYQILLRTIRSVWSFLIVRSKIGGKRGDAGDADLVEYHHLPHHFDSKHACIANEDGAGSSPRADRKYLERGKRCVIDFLWRPDAQGLNTRTRVTPQLRTFTISDREVSEIGAELH